MKEKILKALEKIALAQNIDPKTIKLEYPEDISHGDFSTNIALANAKKLGKSPKELAESIAEDFRKNQPAEIESVSIAGPGFINFKIKDSVFVQEIANFTHDHSSRKERNKNNKNVLVEYTDPNTFKVFHIGHLMSNAIGESISRLIETGGSKVVRLCYPSDIGLHIAKSVWAMEKNASQIPSEDAPIQEKTNFLGKMYVEGTEAYEKDEKSKDDIDALNKIIYERSSPRINELYKKGRDWSLEHFEMLYKRLGTKFEETIFESEMAGVGLEIVKSFLKKEVFQESEGAIIFKGEDHGLHIRVFINSHGLPTYEAKEVGLNVTKFQKYPDADQSIIVTASEQNDYFKVLKKVLTLIDDNVGSKTLHIGHGMMRFASGKMSSRTGKVVTAEALIEEIKEMVRTKIADRGFDAVEADEISDTVAIGAIKYTILRQAIGGDIIFDSAASISFEGDSGPYLQYAVVRANSVLEKAKQEGIEALDINGKNSSALPEKVVLLEKLLVRYADVLERAHNEQAPQHVAGYLVSLAGAFNSFYANQTITDKNNSLSPYYVALTKAFQLAMVDGLWVLGIKVPKKM